VPANVSINYTIWERHAERLDTLQEECPHVPMSGKADGDSPRSVEHKEMDAWGCLWHYPGTGLDGQVIDHPLDSWEKFGEWRPPSAAERLETIKKEAEKRPDGERPPSAGLEHGFLFLRLTYLRGFENFMIDVAEETPKLYELRDIVADYWYEITKAHLDCGATRVAGGDDLGLQDRLPISPDSWRKLIKPAYSRIFGLARERGATVRLHTDGYIVDIIPDLIETGVTDLNPQDLVNGLDNLVRLAKGKIHISLDVDRQSITAFGTPGEIDVHIEKCIRTLGSPRGGLSLIWGVYPGTPIENIEAAVRAMEKYRDMWVE
jgi:uroporphyrinogen-III decarboxylase